ncbi:MAG: glycosyltransferase family 39 protein [bacterium]
MSVPETESSFSYHLWLLALVAGVAGTLLFRLGEVPSQTAAEWRCRQVITGMVTTGDLLVPRGNGVPHLTKPPLFYWHAVFWSRLLGHAGRFQQRFPSVLCALGLLGLTYVWGRSIGGASVGLVAAACLAMTNLLYSMGRRGTYDSQFAFLCVAALLTANYYRTSRRGWLVPIFALLAALAFLTKGPPVFMFVGLPILIYLIERRHWNLVFDRRVWPWLLLIVPLSLSWGAVILLKVPEARKVFLSEVVLPLGVEVGETTAHHYKSPLFFIERSPSILFPALLLLPLVIRQAWRTRGWRETDALRLCFWAVSGPLVFLSIIPQKQPHYFLPLLAPLSVLYGITLVETVPTHIRTKWFYVPGRLLGLSSCVTAGIFIFFFWRIIPESVWFWGGCCVVMLALGSALVFGSLHFRGASLLSMSLLITWTAVLCFYGSFNIWDLQFKHGVVFDRPEYQEEQWKANFEQYPWLQKIFKVKYHGEQVIETP